MEAALEFFRSNTFIISLLALVTAIVIARINYARDQRRITYRIQSTRLFSFNDQSPVSGLEVRLDGEEIHELWSHSVEIKNDGQKDLVGRDLTDAIRIHNTTTAYQPVLQEEVPSAKLQLENSTEITLDIKLLKRGEHATISYLSLTKNPPTVTIRATDFVVRMYEHSKRPPWKFVRENAQSYVSIAVLVISFWYYDSSVWNRIDSNRPIKDVVYWQETDKEKKTRNIISTMSSIRDVATLVRSRALNSESGTDSKFDSKSVPEWANSKLNIAEWGGPTYALDAIVHLRDRGVHVKSVVHATNSRPTDARKDDAFFEITASKDEFPYSVMTHGGVFR